MLTLRPHLSNDDGEEDTSFQAELVRRGRAPHLLEDEDDKQDLAQDEAVQCHPDRGRGQGHAQVKRRQAVAHQEPKRHTKEGVHWGRDGEEGCGRPPAVRVHGGGGQVYVLHGLLAQKWEQALGVSGKAQCIRRHIIEQAVLNGASTLCASWLPL